MPANRLTDGEREVLAEQEADARPSHEWEPDDDLAPTEPDADELWPGWDEPAVEVEEGGTDEYPW